MSKRILIACPVRDREFVLSHYLDHIYKVDYKKSIIDLYFIINNSKDNSLQLLKNFQKSHKDEYNSITIETHNDPKIPQDDRSKVIRDNYIYDHLSTLRNMILKKCVELDCDYVLSCDCDILVQPDILNRLLSHNKPIVASLIYNGYLHRPQGCDINYNPIENAWRFPNILKKLSDGTYQHIANYKVKNWKQNPEGTLLEVDFTGAVSIISKDACKVMEYAWNVLGEDLPACQTAQANGFKLYCDVSCYSQHIMSKELLQVYLEGKL
jgi:hypothetical protein